MTKNDKYIMVVDDNNFVREILEQYVLHFGYHPIICKHTKEAREVFLERKHTHQPLDLILMDIKMPENNPKPTGLELGRELSQLYNFKNIIYITGYSAERATQKEVSELNSTCIPKPFKMTQLQSEIEKHLNNLNYLP